MPKRIDREMREVELAEAAWRVLLNGGVRDLSVRKVAAEAGLTTGSLRRAFPSQRALLEFSVDLVVERAGARMRAVQGDTPRAHVLAVLCEALPLDAQRRTEMDVWLALTGEPNLRHVAQRSDVRLRELCVELLKRLAKVGELAEGRNLQLEAARLHALLDGLALHLVRGSVEGDGRWAVEQLDHHLTTLRAPVG